MMGNCQYHHIRSESILTKVKHMRQKASPHGLKIWQIPLSDREKCISVFKFYLYTVKYLREH